MVGALTLDCLREGPLELRVRPAVALRSRVLADGIAHYLSLYAEEIDERAEAFWQWLHGSEPGSVRAAWGALELTDVVVYLIRREHVWVARGAAATFPLYWSRRDPGLVVSTALPVTAGEPLSRHGLLAAAAGACVHGSYEPNGFTATPLAHWRRVLRGTALRFSAGALAAEHVIDPGVEHGTPAVVGIAGQAAAHGARGRDTIARRLRAAFDAYSHSQRAISSSLVEVSGGFDSTLSAAPLARRGMRGVSVAFPYYEFRFEGAVQLATAEFLGIPRVELDGADLFPFTPADRLARLDAPSVFVTGIRHAEQVARLAEAHAAQRIYMGHGGDQCFATDLLSPEALVPNPPTRSPFSAAAWSIVRRALDAMQRSPLRHRHLGAFVYDAAQDVWVKESFGATVRTPFSDLAVFRAALDWSHWCRAQRVVPDKTILADAARDLLPPSVLTRKGKVAYDGVWSRARRSQAAHVAESFEQVRSVFDVLGVSVDWLQRRTHELGAWQDKSDREVLALYAIAYWLSAWGIQRAVDVTWSEQGAA